MISVLMSVQTIAAAQTISVTGRVTERASNEPLTGVVVVVRGDATKSAVTNTDGYYTLSVSADAVLKFSCTGYAETDVAVDGRTAIDVQMDEASTEMDEVVVVGVSMRRTDLTGAVGRISNEKLEELPVVTVNQAMQGRMAGVYVQSYPAPGNSASIKIRGSNSISYGTDPIYVVDGVIMTGGFNSVNLNDVASIDVLKDASATALYGSRGANGIVVITTKRGRAGGKVSYDGWLGWQTFARTLPKMNAQQTFDLRVDAYANRYMEVNPGADRRQYIQSIATSGSPDAVFDKYEFDAIAEGKSYDWLDEVTRGGFQQNHAVSLSGASDKGNYFLSFGYAGQSGLLKDSDYERVTGRVNLEQRVKSWLKAGTNTSFSRIKENRVEGSVFGNAFAASPFYAPNDKDVYMKWGADEQNGVNNPLKSLTVDNDLFQNRLNSTNYISVTPGDDLVLRASFSLDYSNQTEYVYNPKNTGQSIRNSLDGEAIHQKNEWLNWQWDVSAAYDRTFALRHRVSAMVAFNASEDNAEWNRIAARGFASNDFIYKYLGGSSKKEINDYSSDFASSSIVAFVERVNYSYDSRYYATLTLRQEASSKIARDYRWGMFPSLALGWVVSEENFLRRTGVFDLLKLRAGYGIVGNQNIPLYAYYSLYRPSVTGGTVSYNSDGRMGNPAIRWERQKQFNVGLDVAVLNNRLSLTADYFHINNDDLLMQRSLSSLTGFSNTIANVGAMTNKGFEFTADFRIFDRKDFGWNVSANISFTKNKITKLYGDVDVIWNMGGWTNAEIQRTGNLFLGESINSIYVLKFDKIAQQEDMERVADMNFGGRTVRPGDILPVDVDGNKIIDDRDRYVVGNTDPKFFGGFSTYLHYKGFGLNAVFNYSQGNKRLSGTYEGLMSSNGRSVAHRDLLNRWTPENTATDVPRAYSEGGRFSFGDVDWGVQDASFLRLSALTLSYSLPTQWTEKIRIDGAQVYFTGNNLFVATSYKGYDPEGGDGYPSSRMYVLGLRFDF